MKKILQDPRWKEILEDRTHGASVLIDWTLALIGSYTDEEVGDPVKLLQELEKQLKSAHPGIPALINVTRIMRKELEIFKSVSLSAKELEKKRSSHKEKLIQKCAELILEHPNVLSISYSGLIRDSLLKAQESGGSPKLFIGEGRPQCEGALLATELAQKGLNCVVFADLAFADFLEKIQLALVGADAVFEESFINKTGTRLLLEHAKAGGVTTALVCDFTKRVPYDLMPAEIPDENPQELLPVIVQPPNLTVHNKYFEVVSLSLVDVEICWDGPGATV